MEWQGFLEPHSYESFFDFSPPQIEEKHTGWSFEENKLFENALAEFDPSSPTFFEKIASRVPSKSIEDIKNHYQALVEDIELIESGLIEPPEYQDDQCNLMATENGKASSSKQQKGTASQQKRRGVPWTEDEHRLFLKGLDEYGKGDWRSISRYCVISKSPTQIASHAQKYFRRLQTSTPAERRRPSIHDIHNVTSTTTNLEQTDEQLPPPPPPPPSSFPYNNITNASNSQQQSHAFLNYHSSASAPPITPTATILVPPETTEQPLPPQSSFSYNNMMINANNNSFSPPMTTTTTTFPQAEPTPARQSSTACPSSSLPALPRRFWS